MNLPLWATLWLWPLPTQKANLIHRLGRSAGKRLAPWIRPGSPPSTDENSPEVKKRRLRNEQDALAYFNQPERLNLLGYIKDSISTGCGLTDYYFLHSYITKRKPALILEMGSGRSSIILAHALREVHLDTGHKGHLDTLESLEEYYLQARSLCPDFLSEYITYHHSPAIHGLWRHGIYGSSYTTIPERAYDFIFVDGPTSDANGGLFRFIETTQYPTDVVTDRRRITMRTLARYMQSPDKWGYDFAMDLGLFRAISSHDLKSIPSPPVVLPDRDALQFFTSPA